MSRPARPLRGVGGGGRLEFDDIERILELMRTHELSEFELEREGLKLRVRKTLGAFPPPVAPGPVHVAPLPQAAPGPADPPPVLTGPTALDDDAVELAVVKSPIVGTFYRSPEPGAAAFVEVGQRVRKDQVLCIIEAMKLMNEITSEYDGEIVSAYVDNGKPVQYGERLFAIRTS
jgi:acetyl-CoA carboxylase biotin carboxyl carrier protein